LRRTDGGRRDHRDRIHTVTHHPVNYGSDRSTAETGNWQAESLVSGLQERLFMFMAAWASSATLRAWTTRSAVKVAER
jgi:hypothetical protein